MNKEEFYKEFEEKISQLNLELSSKQLEEFYKYMKLLQEWNEKINLTAIIEDNEILLKHFIDSLTIMPYIKENDKIIDVGTGAGFPGIPLKIFSENTDITLMDSLNKRIIFLNEVIKELSLDKIKAVHARAEEFAVNKIHRENYDVVVSRAVAGLNTLLEYMLPFVKVNGVCICMKGPNIQEEIKESKRALGILGGQIEKIDKICLPDSDIERNIIIVKKVKNTPKQYPRKAGKPSKEPIM